MKMRNADVVWTPVFEPSVLKEYPALASPNAGDVRIERHLSGWRRTPGDRWIGATCLGEMGEVRDERASREKKKRAAFDDVAYGVLPGVRNEPAAPRTDPRRGRRHCGIARPTSARGS